VILKNTMIKLLFIVLLPITAINALYAQSGCACCNELHQQFGFWVGEWTVVDSLGVKVGDSQISSIEDNCIILEHWKGVRGGTGSSFNYFDPSDSTWNQLWIDNSGNILKLKGNAGKDKMVLKSELTKSEKLGWYINQITWTLNEDGTVTQLWEIVDKNDRLLQTLFSGIYHRKN
jgi:hypothetical protein